MAPSNFFFLGGYLANWDLQRVNEATWDYQLWALRSFWKRPEPNPLKILTRALNGLWLRVCAIRQPCWRSTRFKSLT